MSTTEMRKEAREALSGKWGKAVCITLIFLALSFIVGFIEGLVGEGSVLYTIIDIAYLIVSIPLSFGLLISFMKLKRGEEVSCVDFFKEGFSRFGKSWGIWWHTFIRLLLPIICFIVLIALMVAITIFNTSTMLNGSTVSSTSNLGLSLIFVVLEIACIIYIVSRAYLYIIAYNIAYDNPELSSKACVLKSAALMKGNRGSFFLLELSFIGWAILGIFTLGIGYLWLMPYMQVAVICFYDRLAKPEVKVIEEEVKIEE